jgi:hypothetical protein
LLEVLTQLGHGRFCRIPSATLLPKFGLEDLLLAFQSLATFLQLLLFITPALMGFSESCDGALETSFFVFDRLLLVSDSGLCQFAFTLMLEAIIAMAAGLL